MKQSAVKASIFLLVISLGISSCDPVAYAHYDIPTEKDDHDNPILKKEKLDAGSIAFIVGGATLAATGVWRIAKYLDHKLGQRMLENAEDTFLAARKHAPMFYKGNIDKPPLYKLIAPDGSEHWLLGSMHPGGVSLDHFPANSKVFEAIDESSTVFFEYDAGSAWQTLTFSAQFRQQTRYQKAIRTDDFDLRATLGDAHMEKLLDQYDSATLAELSELGIHVDRLSPTQAFEALNNSSYMYAFGLSDMLMDAQLMLKSRQAGKKVIGLAKGKDQANAFKTVSESKVTVEDLKKLLDDGGIKARAKKLLEMRDAYGQGDLERATSINNGMLPSNFAEKTLLDDRNIKWVKSKKIQKNCQHGETCTIVVGFRHLFEGDNSLAKLLAAEGFKIEKIY